MSLEIPLTSLFNSLRLLHLCAGSEQVMPRLSDLHDTHFGRLERTVEREDEKGVPLYFKFKLQPAEETANSELIVVATKTGLVSVVAYTWFAGVFLTPTEVEFNCTEICKQLSTVWNQGDGSCFELEVLDWSSPSALTGLVGGAFWPRSSGRFFRVEFNVVGGPDDTWELAATVSMHNQSATI